MMNWRGSWDIYDPILTYPPPKKKQEWSQYHLASSFQTCRDASIVKILAALPGDQGLVPGTQMVDCDCL